ncbi:hypothetical protein [Methylomonas methanica]|uniref:hypothetical protein n=1 Tax=Methylomonas methanica TaxID=421 RepID=UPI00059C09FA|nr:hypothetical protein [Methylomonas methanica]
MKKNKIIVVLLTLAILGIYPSLCFYSENKVDRVFKSAKMGDSKKSIIAVLGKPDGSEQCGKWLWWGDDGHLLGDNKGECVDWIRYNFFLHAYGFGFSKEGNIVSKYQYFSE